jgi:excisionase family DNA binding protein
MASPINRIANALERIAAAMEAQSERSAHTLTPEGLSKQDAARFLGVDLPTVEHLIRTRRLAFTQFGSQRGRVIAVEDLRRFLKENRQPTGDELLKKKKRD